MLSLGKGMAHLGKQVHTARPKKINTISCKKGRQPTVKKIRSFVAGC